jgi:type IV secretory pathway VirB3-like protein
MLQKLAKVTITQQIILVMTLYVAVWVINALLQLVIYKTHIYTYWVFQKDLEDKNTLLWGTPRTIHSKTSSLFAACQVTSQYNR